MQVMRSSRNSSIRTPLGLVGLEANLWVVGLQVMMVMVVFMLDRGLAEIFQRPLFVLDLRAVPRAGRVGGQAGAGREDGRR